MIPGGVRSRDLPPLFFFGTLFGLGGLSLYLAAILFTVFRLLLPLGDAARFWNETIVWGSGALCVVGLMLAALDLVLLLPSKRKESRRKVVEPVGDRTVVVALTAFDDEQSIGPAVVDFRGQPSVRTVLVIDNESRDRTFEEAAQAGGRVIKEPKRGYGHCVYRALQEALADPSARLICLCEGDMTFRGKDLEKLLAFIDHADIVNGTRIVEQLRDYSTQLSTFMYYGNFFVGKLLEFKHMGRGTFTDVGTTYKLVRRESLERLMPLLNPNINLAFNAHFLDTALGNGECIVECPITFHARVGISKGGNTSNARAARVGLEMIAGLVFGWKARPS